MNDPLGVTFYGTYPPVDWYTESEGKMFTGMEIPANQKTVSSTNLKPDMSHAYMLSAPAAFDNEKMYLDFFPLFNAFYIELKSQDNTSLVIDAVSLTSSSDNLAGPFDYYTMVNGTAQLTREGPLVSGVDHTGAAIDSVSVDLAANNVTEENRTIASDKSLGVTLLALPPETDSITNVTLHVTYHVGSGAQKRANLDLKYADNKFGGKFIEFGAFHKARIIGLAMEGGSQWQLTVDDPILDPRYQPSH